MLWVTISAHDLLSPDIFLSEFTARLTQLSTSLSKLTDLALHNDQLPFNATSRGTGGNYLSHHHFHALLFLKLVISVFVRLTDSPT